MFPSETIEQYADQFAAILSRRDPDVFDHPTRESLHALLVTLERCLAPFVSENGCGVLGVVAELLLGHLTSGYAEWLSDRSTDLPTVVRSRIRRAARELRLLEDIYTCNQCRAPQGGPLFHRDPERGIVPFGVLKHRYRFPRRPTFLVLGIAPQSKAGVALLPQPGLAAWLDFHLLSQNPYDDPVHNTRYHRFINDLLDFPARRFEDGELIHADLWKCRFSLGADAFHKAHGDELNRCIVRFMNRVLVTHRPRILVANGLLVCREIVRLYPPGDPPGDGLFDQSRYSGYSYTISIPGGNDNEQKDVVTVVLSRFISYPGRGWRKDMIRVRSSIEKALERSLRGERPPRLDE